MSITSMLFLFLFLPLSLAVYYISSDKAKEYVLLAISLLFYALGSLRYLVLFTAASLLTVLLGRVMAKTERKGGKVVLLVIGILLNVGLLGYYKYTDFIIATVNSIGNTAWELRDLMLPLGISFFTFKAISYLADVYRGTAELDPNPMHDMLYLSFFAQIQSGPISRYSEMHSSAAGGPARADLFSDGVYRFLIGFNKKVLIANVLANISNEVFGGSFDGFSVSYAWLGSICYSLQLFFDFAGYSDMAIGITEMFGYNCRENFHYPYMTESVSGFWKRWHMSLSQWFRDYIYIPLGGSRNDKPYKVYRNLLVVWILTGIWHGADWNFVLWGLGYFVLITFEKATGLPERFRTKAGKIIYRVFSLLFINAEWVLFRAGSLRTGLGFLRRMFVCEKNPLADSRTLFLVKDYWFFLLLAVVLCFPLVPWMGRKLENRKTLHTVYNAAVGVLVLAAFVWSVSLVVSGQNNPFLYANF